MGSKIPRRMDYAIPCDDIEEDTDNCTMVYRKRLCQDELIENFDPPFISLYDLFEATAIQHPLAKCMGDLIQPEGYPRYYRWLNYNQTFRLVERTAKLLQKFALVGPSSPLVAIMAPNCNAWMLIDLALNKLGYASVPFYPALSPPALATILHETQLTTLCGSATEIQRILKIEENLSQLQYLVAFQPISDEISKLAEQKGMKVFDFWALLESPDLDNFCIENKAKISLHTLFTLSYTSGTTGKPKGVMLTNGNFISSLKNLSHVHPIYQSDCIISYLPLAHLMGRNAAYAVLIGGGCVGNFSGDISKLMDDIQLLKPTLFPVVPRILNKIYHNVLRRLQSAPFYKRGLFNRALAVKTQELRRTGLVHHKLYDKAVLGPLRGILGGRVRSMVTGSAPIAQEVIQFFRAGFSCSVLEGYGSTESTAVSFMTHSFEVNTGIVGGPTVGTEFKLEDVPSLGYMSTDKPYPRGQVCIRGPGIFQGYYKQPELTNLAVDELGWLHTGDIGMIVERGALKLIDRKKNIFKLSQGEYIAPEKIEKVLENSPLIAQAFVYGDSLKDNIVAIIVPEEEALRDKFNREDYQFLCQTARVRDALVEEMERVADRAQLNRLERVHGHFHIEPKAWTPEDLLTPSLKLQRHKAKERYEEVLAQLYEG